MSLPDEIFIREGDLPGADKLNWSLMRVSNSQVAYVRRRLVPPIGKICDYWNCPFEGLCKNTDACDHYVVHDENPELKVSHS